MGLTKKLLMALRLLMSLATFKRSCAVAGITYELQITLGKEKKRKKRL